MRIVNTIINLFSSKKSDSIPVNIKYKKNKIYSLEKKGLTITNGMIINIEKKGNFYKAYCQKSRENYSSVISKARRKKAWSNNKDLKAKLNADRITWSLIESKKYKDKLIEKYGEKFALAILANKVINGMSIQIIENLIGKPTYRNQNVYYFGKPFNRKMTMSNRKLVNDERVKNYWIDMPLEMLIASLGNPDDSKENVTKTIKKKRLFYNGRRNIQGGISYEYQIDIENNLVVGWKEL